MSHDGAILGSKGEIGQMLAISIHIAPQISV
jgi:hypothetical protein